MILRTICLGGFHSCLLLAFPIGYRYLSIFSFPIKLPAGTHSCYPDRTQSMSVALSRSSYRSSALWVLKAHKTLSTVCFRVPRAMAPEELPARSVVH
ncbi:hypothetical protein EDD17DRAFT_452825 [Pisolithus thermaeus]|nr:hypothetical protein EV401DRAFT_1384734 [Pisolithus croceorrhizus]KAI6168953.1 hypothetical protein EDD17DRAFT_452825 [Pisolithus thermaeus]